jgi:hypothetical protein
MKFFSILKEGDECILKQYPLVEWRLDPRASTTNQSGVTTTPLDGVSVLLAKYQIFQDCILNIVLLTSFYTSRIRSPTDAQLFFSLNK